MRKTLIVIFVCVGLNSFANNKEKSTTTSVFPSDTTVLSQILSLSLSTYIGKPVDSLLSILPSNYTFRGFMPVRIAYNRGVFQAYGNSGTNTVTIQIFIDNYQYLTFPDTARTNRWDMNLAKQEIISFIKVIKNNNICLYGCNNTNYEY